MPLQRKVAKVATLAEILAERMESEARQAIEERGRFSLAVPGGSVATRFFPRLAAAAIDWSRTDFFQADERAVPPDHPDANFAGLSAYWLEPAHVPPARVHRMEAEDGDLDAAARRYEAGLQATLGSSPRIDLVLLGAGPDGHVASLFPGHAALSESSRLVVPVPDSPKPPPRRLTMTLPALVSARLVVIAMAGAEKAPVARALDDPACDLPVARVARAAEEVLLLLDEEAGGQG